ncbi:hypothetical protein [Alteromonas sp. AMM-1]|uniref:hypothetical protein n=1 Tax=Alteromonas sp. AMM-1 TaxID=3394233 RepID=UPI0039A74DA2
MNGPQVTTEEVEELIAQMQEMQASSAEIDAIRQCHSTDDHFEVLEQNWPVIKWFADVQDLFVYCNGWCRGLDVSAVEADAKLAAREFTAEDYKGLRLLAKHVANERNNRLQKK